MRQVSTSVRRAGAIVAAIMLSLAAVGAQGRGILAADPVDGSWLPKGMCEPWPEPASSEPWPPARDDPREGDPREGDPRADALVAMLSDPAFTAVIDFTSRNIRGGGMFVDGQPLDTDVPVVTVDIPGRALLGGGDWLAYRSLAGGTWAHGELRRGDRQEEHFGTAWQPLDTSRATNPRLPEVLASVVAARPATDAPSGPGHWYDVSTSAVIGPGAMWDVVFPVIRDTSSALRVAVDDDGRPLAGCLAQAWWQGYDETIGEDAALLTAIRFSETGGHSRVPLATPVLDPVSVPQLDLHLGRPEGWEAVLDEESGAYWLWRPDQDGLPSIRVTRERFPGRVLRSIGDMPVESILDGLAVADAEDGKATWEQDPASIEPASFGGDDPAAPAVPGRLVVFHPDFGDIGPHTLIDALAWVPPYRYLFQLVTPIPDELPDRYVFEHVLQTVSFDPPR